MIRPVLQRKKIKMKEATAKVSGSCGELVQGLYGSSLVHITCPVEIFSCATVRLNNHLEINCAKEKWKARQAYIKTLEKIGLKTVGAEIEIKSEIPVGKGMASSTADISATVIAASNLFNADLSQQEIADIALSIEPTDAVMFSGIQLFDHKKGNVRQFVGTKMDIHFLIIDLGGNVDTLEFNKNNYDALLKKNSANTKKAIELVLDGFKKEDPFRVGLGATLSSVANQSILFKEGLEDIIKKAERHGAIGVNIAHSGTVIGVMFDGSFTKIESAMDRIESIFNKSHKSIRARMTDGGGVIL